MITDYTNGVWYDAQDDDFCRIENDEESGNILLVTPDQRDVYAEFDSEDDFPVKNFVRIVPAAVDNPGEFLEGRLERLCDGYYNDVGPVFREEIAIQWALQQVEIVEESDEPYESIAESLEATEQALDEAAAAMERTEELLEDES